jgi:hypothetical protein
MKGGREIYEFVLLKRVALTFEWVWLSLTVETREMLHFK